MVDLNRNGVDDSLERATAGKTVPGSAPVPYAPAGTATVRPTFGGTGAAPAGDVPMVNSGSKIGLAGQPWGPAQALRADGIFNSYNHDPALVPASQYEGLIQQWGMSLKPSDQAKYQGVVEQLRQAGKIPAKGKPALSTVVSLWGEVLLGASYNQQFTPLDYLGELARRGPQGDVPAGPKPAYTGPTSTTTLTNVFDAKALVDSALHTYLGRAASEKELAAFHAQLNGTQSANPNVNSPNGEHGRINTGGSNTGVMAEEFAKSRSDYAETQAATTGMNWLQEAVAGMNNDRMI